MDAIFKRRSIRQYTDDPVSPEQVKQILEAGMCAPSAGNERPWHFIVVSDKEKLVKISQMSEYARMTCAAQLAIIVCGDVSLEIHKGMWVQDCSATTENMLLQIESVGLGSVWLGVHPISEREEFIREMFNLEPNIIPFSVLPIGHKGVEKECHCRYDESRVHYERW